MPANTDASLSLVMPNKLRHLAGESFFGRGDAYFAKGAVRWIRSCDGGVKAAVQGTRRYQVHLYVEGGELNYDCTCPIGQDGGFCKHCVAVGLAWNASGGDIKADSEEKDASNINAGDVQNYLLGLDRNELMSLILEQADEYDRLQRKLTLKAAQTAPETVSLPAWKEALDSALETDDYVPYREACDYAMGIEEVIESLEILLQNGQAENAIGLAEYGLDALEESIGYVDDSDGWMGGLLMRLQELHLEACRIAGPNPVELAERLFEAEMTSDYDTFYRAALTYADILGETGLKVYRRLAEVDWAKIPALGPGDEDPDRYGRRFRITSIMEALAETFGDFDTLLVVKSRDLSVPYHFLQIAELYQDNGDTDSALDWAEQGWQAFSGTRRDERLRNFIINAYQARGRHDEAMTLSWEAFLEHAWLTTYLQLKRHAERAASWRSWRGKALALIRERIASGKAEPRGRQDWMRAPSQDHSLLVEVFLAEGDPTAAWREAQAGGCSKGLWLELAKSRERSCPEDAVQIYKNHVAGLLRNTGDRVYQETIGFLGRIEEILGRAGAIAGFRPYLTEIRETHKRKRNLMKMFDQKGW